MIADVRCKLSRSILASLIQCLAEDINTVTSEIRRQAGLQPASANRQRDLGFFNATSGKCHTQHAEDIAFAKCGSRGFCASIRVSFSA